MNRYIRSATRSINTSLSIEISDGQFEKILMSGVNDEKRACHVKIFLQESPVELIHNLVLSGATNFQALESLYIRYASSSKTRSLVHEMAR